MASSDPTSQTSISSTTNGRAIACLGRIVPEGEIIHLAAPYSLQSPSLISEIKVQEGDHVVRGQLLAVTHNQALLEATWHLAEAQIKVAQSRLAQVEAGEKSGEIAAAKAEWQRLRAEFGNAGNDFRRQEKLYRTGVISASEFDRSTLGLETSSNQVERAAQKLASITEVRNIDVELARAEVDAAKAAATRARAEFDQTSIRAPIDGQIIKIHTHAGEQAGPGGILDLAKTDSIFVNAEVYETDIGRVKKGMRAEITGDSFAGKIQGAVERVGLQISRNDLLKTDPSAFSDLRVVEVKIRLDQGRAVAGLLHAQVSVRILE